MIGRRQSSTAGRRLEAGKPLAILCAGMGQGSNWFSTILGFMAVVLAMINIVGGFMVTDRMLHMFKRKKD